MRHAARAPPAAIVADLAYVSERRARACRCESNFDIRFCKNSIRQRVAFGRQPMARVATASASNDTSCSGSAGFLMK